MKDRAQPPACYGIRRTHSVTELPDAGGRLHRGSASERPGPMDLSLCGGERDPGAHRHHVCSPFP
ncbi:hypothetical protein NGA_0728100, partial [Nannochloropsis gaditana CCMP526]|uniref:uncharacterized protein n=1 Tax=Nannochloropsis gaditana (strain CCMP526) TaxID=1093141 RepID=UPI00029F7DC5